MLLVMLAYRQRKATAYFILFYFIHFIYHLVSDGQRTVFSFS